MSGSLEDTLERSVATLYGTASLADVSLPQATRTFVGVSGMTERTRKLSVDIGFVEPVVSAVELRDRMRWDAIRTTTASGSAAVTLVDDGDQATQRDCLILLFSCYTLRQLCVMERSYSITWAAALCDTLFDYAALPMATLFGSAPLQDGPSLGDLSAVQSRGFQGELEIGSEAMRFRIKPRRFGFFSSPINYYAALSLSAFFRHVKQNATGDLQFLAALDRAAELCGLLRMVGVKDQRIASLQAATIAATQFPSTA